MAWLVSPELTRCTLRARTSATPLRAIQVAYESSGSACTKPYSDQLFTKLFDTGAQPAKQLLCVAFHSSSRCGTYCGEWDLPWLILQLILTSALLVAPSVLAFVGRKVGLRRGLLATTKAYACLPLSCTCSIASCCVRFDHLMIKPLSCGGPVPENCCSSGMTDSAADTHCRVRQPSMLRSADEAVDGLFSSETRSVAVCMRYVCSFKDLISLF